jgi:DNA-binding MarR family transcriptional regulator
VTAPVFDATIHPPTRLQICAVLAPLDEAEFQVVRDEVGISDSVLSKQVAHLEAAGYVRVTKRTVATRQRTWLALTARGRAAFAGHVAALQRLAGAAGI